MAVGGPPCRMVFKESPLVPKTLTPSQYPLVLAIKLLDQSMSGRRPLDARLHGSVRDTVSMILFLSCYNTTGREMPGKGSATAMARVHVSGSTPSTIVRLQFSTINSPMIVTRICRMSYFSCVIPPCSPVVFHQMG